MLVLMYGIKMIKLFNNKKGIIFTLLAILLSTMFVLILTGGVSNRIDQNIEVSSLRADMIESYYDSFIDYSEYVIKLSAKSCINSITKKMVDDQFFYPDETTFYDDIAHCMITSNISYSGEEMLTSSENTTVDKLFQLMINLTDNEYDLQTDYNINEGDIEISFNDSFGNPYVDELKVSYKLKVYISDETTFLSLPEYSNTMYISFEGAYDPYVPYDSDEQIKDIVVIGENEAEFLGLTMEEFLQKIDYVQFQIGISMMNRIINNSDISDNGIISFVNESVNLPGDYSYVDIHVINQTSFECYELYCQYKSISGNPIQYDCADTFRIDTKTFNSLAVEQRYDLDVFGWGKECIGP